MIENQNEAADAPVPAYRERIEPRCRQRSGKPNRALSRGPSLLKGLKAQERRCVVDRINEGSDVPERVKTHGNYSAVAVSDNGPGEFFGAEILKSEDDASFEVKLASTGRVIVVPKDKTVVQALAAVGVEIATSCEQGVCGTCLTRVLEGEPDHKDTYLTPEEQMANDQFTPCCSRSNSPLLVLDL